MTCRETSAIRLQIGSKTLPTSSKTELIPVRNLAQTVTNKCSRAFSPDGLLTRSHSEYVEGVTLIGMIEEDLIAERVAIDSYRETINYLESDDPTTRRMLEGILAMEEEHAEDLAGLLKELGS
jgi:bacterioferritin